MESYYSKKKWITIIDNIKKGPKYNYLRLKGEIILSANKVYNVPILDINFDRWYANSVMLWPRGNKSQNCFECWLDKLHQVHLLIFLFQVQ